MNQIDNTGVMNGMSLYLLNRSIECLGLVGGAETAMYLIDY